MAVERTIGQFKRRFPCLIHGLRFKKVVNSCNMITALACVFNICKMYNDRLEDENECVNNLGEIETENNAELTIQGVQKRIQIAQFLNQ